MKTNENIWQSIPKCQIRAIAPCLIWAVPLTGGSSTCKAEPRTTSVSPLCTSVPHKNVINRELSLSNWTKVTLMSQTGCSGSEWHWSLGVCMGCGMALVTWAGSLSLPSSQAHIPAMPPPPAASPWPSALHPSALLRLAGRLGSPPAPSLLLPGCSGTAGAWGNTTAQMWDAAYSRGSSTPLGYYNQRATPTDDVTFSTGCTQQSWESEAGEI